MARRKTKVKNESHSENCVTNQISAQKRAAINNLATCKEYEKSRKFKYIPHPTTYRALKRVEILD